MKHLKPFPILETEEPINSRLPFTQFLISELDRMGVKWHDTATPRQKKNGTAVLHFSIPDAIRFFTESGWIEQEARPRVKNKLLDLSKEIIDYFSKGETSLMLKVMALVEPDETVISTFFRKPEIILYVYRHYLVGDHYGSPSANPRVRWEPTDRTSWDQAMTDIVNYEMRPKIFEFIAALPFHFWDNLSNANLLKKLPQSLGDQIIDQYGAMHISEQILRKHHRDPALFWRVVDLSQAKFKELMSSAELPEEIKEEISRNPNYSAPDDLLSDWF